ncbi:MAG: hypothetical protein VKK42_07065 [Lyngbya sp.]|nr:hypothetical protein [Lyngbya sp.]
MNTSNVSPRQLRTRAFAITVVAIDERDRHSGTPIVWRSRDRL